MEDIHSVLVNTLSAAMVGTNSYTEVTAGYWDTTFLAIQSFGLQMQQS